MGDKSTIQWTEATWNPIWGCTKISPGCAHCYIERTPPFRAQGLQFVRGHIPLRLHPDRLDQPLRWTRPRRVFVNSLSDLFHVDVPREFSARVFAVMAWARQHTFQVLTKREGRLHALLTDAGFRADVEEWVTLLVEDENRPPALAWDPLARRKDDARARMPDIGGQSWPLPNVRVGVSIENQPMADRRFPVISELGEGGWSTMVSLEPLLGPVRIPDRYLALGRRAWLVPGGESGPGARPCDLAWVEAVVTQGLAASVACFVKQLGSQAYDGSLSNGGLKRRVPLRHRQGGDMTEWPAALRVRDYPEEVPREVDCQALRRMDDP